MSTGSAKSEISSLQIPFLFLRPGSSYNLPGYFKTFSMWIIEADVNGLKYWVQVTKHDVRLNGLKDNAACYPDHAQAIDAARAYKDQLPVELTVVHKEPGVVRHMSQVSNS